MATLGQENSTFSADYIPDLSEEEKLTKLNAEEKEIQTLIGRFQSLNPEAGEVMDDTDVEKLIKYFNDGKLKNISQSDLQKMAYAVAKSTVMTPPEQSKYSLAGGSIKDLDKVKQKMLDLAKDNKTLLEDVASFEKLTDLQMQSQQYLQMGQLKDGKSLEDLKKEINEQISKVVLHDKKALKKLNEQRDALGTERLLEVKRQQELKGTIGPWYSPKLYYKLKAKLTQKKIDNHPIGKKNKLTAEVSERNLLITSLEGKVAGRGIFRNWGSKIKLGWERKKQAKEQAKLNAMLNPAEISKRLEVLNAKLESLNINGMASATMLKRAEQAKARIAAEMDQLNLFKTEKLQTWDTTKSAIRLDYDNGMNDFRAKMAENSMDIAKREEWLSKGSKYKNLLNHMTPEQQEIFRAAIKANGGENENFEKSLTMDNDFLTKLNQVLPPEERQKVSHMIEDFKRVSEGTYQPSKKEQEIFDNANRIDLKSDDDISVYKQALQTLTKDGDNKFSIDENSNAEFKSKAIIAAHELGLEIENFDRMKFNSGVLIKSDPEGLTPETLKALEKVEKEKALKATENLKNRDMSQVSEKERPAVTQESMKEGRKLHAAFDAVKKQVAKNSLNKDGSYSERKANKMMFDVVKAASHFDKETYEIQNTDSYQKLSPEAKAIVDNIQLVRKHDKAEADKKNKVEKPVTLTAEEQKAYVALTKKQKNDLKIQGKLISELSGRTVKRQKQIVKRNMNANSMQRNNLIQNAGR